MKLDSSSKSPSFQDVTQMLSQMKTLLIDVVVEKSLPDASRIKLKDCISMVETFSNFLNNNLKKQEQNSDNLLKPLHSGLSRSTECLHAKKGHMSKSRSTSDLANFDLYDNDEGDHIDLNSLKENYLQAVNEFNNKSGINGEVNTPEINNTKPEVNYDKPETSQSKPYVNSTKTDPNNEINNTKPEMNGTKPEANEAEPEMNEDKPEVVRREGNVNPKPRRKRDSSTLFDISLDDITEPDHSGFLIEKHSGKEWWCVLQDQHLCMFPSQHPQELAYDVLLVPCCEISLDDVYTESPVFRLTQVGSTPWVFSAGIERNLRAWIRALYRACGRDDADWSMRSSKKGRGRKNKNQKRNMKVLTSTIDESEEVEEPEEEVEQMNGTVEEKKALEDGIEGKETGAEEDVEHENGMKTLEGNGKEQIKADETEQEVGLENGLKIEDGNGGKDGINRSENGKIKMVESKEQVKSGNGHQPGKNLVEKSFTVSEEKSENREEPKTLDYPELDQQANENGNLNEAKKDEQQDEVSKAINESQEHTGESDRDDKQDINSENGNNTCSPPISFDDDHSDYVIPLQSVEQNSHSHTECLENAKRLGMERRATKKRIKMLRWLKKAIVDKGEEDATVIGDIYRIEGPDNHVKLWCLLRDRQLYCYRRVTDTTHDSVIPLDNCTAVPSAVISGQKYAFDIKREGVKLVTFAARSSKEQARWIEIVKSKRGKIPLAEIEDESGEEAAGSGTSEEDDDDSHEYIEVNNNETRKKFKTDGEYVLPMSEDGIEDGGYISVLALECEIDRRKTCRKNKKYNPNITNKSGIEYLIEKDIPSFLSTIPKAFSRGKHRSPAPLPKDATRFSQVDVSQALPAIHVDNGTERGSGGETDKVLESLKDLNNNAEDESMETENFSGQFAEYEDVSNDEQEILHCQLTASSWLSDSPPCQARFGPRRDCRKGATGAWRPETNDKIQFLEIDLGDVTTVGAIAIKGRPNFDEKGGEFVKSFTIHYSIDKETWTPYKSHGKIKIFQGSSSASQECKKYLKTKTTAQYFRIYPQSWQNHIALRVALYQEDVKSKGMKKKGDKSKPTSPIGDHPVSPNTGRKMQLKKEDISDPMYPSSDCLITAVANLADIKENGIKYPNTVDYSDNSASMESRIKLKEKLLSKEKREQITKLEVLTKHVEQAKDRMIVGSSSGQLKREAIESEHDYLVANLELVKAKKRLIDIETEMRELRLFEEKYGVEQPEVQHPETAAKPTETAARRPETAARPTETAARRPEIAAKPTETARPTEITRPTKPPLRRRPSKEVMVCSDAVSPVVDREAFNSPGDLPPSRKVLNNVKMFENFQK